jgi:hypothetical protein
LEQGERSTLALSTPSCKSFVPRRVVYTAAQTFVRAKTQTYKDLVALRKVGLLQREGKRGHARI